MASQGAEDSQVPPRSSAGSTMMPPQPSTANKRDIGWSYGFNPGNDKNEVECTFCHQKYNGGIHRLKKHIAGIKGDAKACPKASEEAREACRKNIEETSKKKNIEKRRRDSIQDDVLASEPGADDGADDSVDSPPSQVQPSLKRIAMGPMDVFTCSDPELAARLKGKMKMKQGKLTDQLMKEKREWVHDLLADWAFQKAIPFNAMICDSFLKACAAIGQYGPTYKPPSMYQWREPLLKRAVERTKKSLVEQEVEWDKTGCSLMTDSWTDLKSRSVMNMCVNCRSGIVFLNSDENSEQAHTGEYFFQCVNMFIEEVGAEHMVQNVTDNASANMAEKQLLKVQRSFIFWSSCAAHTIDLVLEGIGKLQSFRGGYC